MRFVPFPMNRGGQYFNYHVLPICLLVIGAPTRGYLCNYTTSQLISGKPNLTHALLSFLIKKWWLDGHCLAM